MTDSTVSGIVGSVGTIIGVLLGFWLSRAAATGDRKRETRAFLDGAQWELKDGATRAKGVAPLPIPIPTVELIVQRGILADIPADLRTRLLQTRTLVTLHNERIAWLIRAAAEKAVTASQVAEQLADQRKTMQAIIPVFESAVTLIDTYLDKVANGWARRLWNRLSGRTTPGATPRRGGSDKPGAQTTTVADVPPADKPDSDVPPNSAPAS